MDFRFTDTQHALRDLARDLFTRESPPARVRGLWEGKPFDRSVWKTMAEAGLLGITVPEQYGGSGGDDVDLALVFEEAGRACLPEPLVETTAFVAPLIAEGGSDEQKERWLPRIVSGDAVVTVEGPWDGHVAWANEADLLVVMRDNELHALTRDRFDATPVATIDPARPLYTVDVRPASETLICRYRDLERPVGARVVTGTACIQNGIAMRLLEDTTAYVKEREQFGKPVGSFQAVKHKLATMHVEVSSSRPTAWYAAYASASRSPEAVTAASIAKLAACATEELCNREALQCHAGIGFTWEHDLHLWLKRGIVLRSTFGDAARHRRTVARQMLDALI